VIARFRPDIVHCFAIHVHLSPSILEAARVAGVPVVMTCNDYKHICPNYKLYHHDRVCFDCRTQNFGNAIRNRCAKGSLALSVASAIEARVHYGKGVYDRLVDHYTFSADFMAGVTEDFWQGRDISWSKLRNPFDSNAHTSEDGDDGHALYFGRLIDEKGVQILVEAAAKVGDMPVKIVGDGPEAAALQTQAASLGLTNVEFLGPLWNNDLMPVLRRARCVVVPSLWHENYPYVINQAFAVGRPVIGSRRGGITELVADGERGLVYDAADPDALARALRTLRDDPDLARRMGRAAKAWSDATFRDDVFYADLRSAYEEAFDAHSGSRR
jgi:glycosyltransferase involved in cell wall biosynthesis